MSNDAEAHCGNPTPFKKSRLTGAKPPLKPKQVWAIRDRLQTANRTRDLALFDLGIDSKLRGCDLVALRIADIALNRRVQSRASIIQRKTGRPAIKPSKTLPDPPETNKNYKDFGVPPCSSVPSVVKAFGQRHPGTGGTHQIPFFRHCTPPAFPLQILRGRRDNHTRPP